MRHLAMIACLLASLPAVASDREYEVRIAFTDEAARPYFQLLYDRLDLKLPAWTLQSYIVSIPAGEEYAEQFDAWHRGAQRTVTINLSKSGIGDVTFSIITGSKDLAEAICEQTRWYAQNTIAARALTDCNRDLRDALST